jgi:hypothetical protein
VNWTWVCATDLPFSRFQKELSMPRTLTGTHDGVAIVIGNVSNMLFGGTTVVDGRRRITHTTARKPEQLKDDATRDCHRLNDLVHAIQKQGDSEKGKQAREHAQSASVLLRELGAWWDRRPLDLDFHADAHADKIAGLVQATDQLLFGPPASKPDAATPAGKTAEGQGSARKTDRPKPAAWMHSARREVPLMAPFPRGAQVIHAQNVRITGRGIFIDGQALRTQRQSASSSSSSSGSDDSSDSD